MSRREQLLDEAKRWVKLAKAHSGGQVRFCRALNKTWTFEMNDRFLRHYNVARHIKSPDPVLDMLMLAEECRGEAG